jgi:Chloramphenicol phosphotransferase-like protein
MQAGSRVVILNGGPSSGKTTLATAFRKQRAAAGDFWLLIGIDDVLSKIPREWKSAGSDRGPFAPDGIRFETTQEGAAVRVGRVGRRMLRRALRRPLSTEVLDMASRSTRRHKRLAKQRHNSGADSDTERRRRAGRMGAWSSNVACRSMPLHTSDGVAPTSASSAASFAATLVTCITSSTGMIAT